MQLTRFLKGFDPRSMAGPPCCKPFFSGSPPGPWGYRAATICDEDAPTRRTQQDRCSSHSAQDQTVTISHWDILFKPDFKEIGGSFLLCFFAAIDFSGDGQAKSGLNIFVTQKLTAWQLFLIFLFFDEKAYFHEKEA